MYLLLAIHIAWTLGAVPLVTRQKRLPASAAAWLALILLLPVAGTLLYVLAGYRPHLPAAERRAYRGDRLGQIIARGCGTRITRHNSVELLHNGNNAFTALIASLQRAVRSIHMEYCIIRDDRIETHHRRNPDTQSPCGTRSARHLRRRRLVAAQPHDAAPHARGGRRDGGFRTGAFPVVHHARHPPQPPQNSRYGRKGRLLGWHKHCEILPRRRLHGQVARPSTFASRATLSPTCRSSSSPTGRAYAARVSTSAAISRRTTSGSGCRSSSHGPKRVPRG